MMTLRRLGGGDEAWFDKLTMTDYQLQACPELVEGPTKGALDFEMELFLKNMFQNQLSFQSFVGFADLFRRRINRRGC